MDMILIRIVAAIGRILLSICCGIALYGAITGYKDVHATPIKKWFCLLMGVMAVFSVLLVIGVIP